MRKLFVLVGAALALLVVDRLPLPTLVEQHSPVLTAPRRSRERRAGVISSSPRTGRCTIVNSTVGGDVKVGKNGPTPRLTTARSVTTGGATRR